MKTSQRGITLIKQFEGFKNVAYRDVVGVWTIGYGFTAGVKEGDKITKAQAESRLQSELKKYEDAVQKACVATLNQHQFDALVSFAWNVGVSGMAKSSVVKAHNRGDTNAAARAFGLWNKAGGKVWPGLTRRRAAEAALYLEPVEDGEDMPQAVEPERSMVASTINRASVVAGGTATVAAVTETVNAVNGLKQGVSELGDWLVPALLVIVTLLAGYIIWERVRQRREGFA